MGLGSVKPSLEFSGRRVRENHIGVLKRGKNSGFGGTQEWGVEQRCEHKRRDRTEKMAGSRGPMKTLVMRQAMVLEIETYTTAVEIKFFIKSLFKMKIKSLFSNNVFT